LILFGRILFAVSLATGGEPSTETALPVDSVRLPDPDSSANRGFYPASIPKTSELAFVSPRHPVGSGLRPNPNLAAFRVAVSGAFVVGDYI
jgi:hypothetical protein